MIGDPPSPTVRECARIFAGAIAGCYVPGTHQPILPPSALAHEFPDVLLLLAWNHAEEIRERESTFTARGGRFITPHSGDF